jgi:hypothetical protein
VVIEVSTVIASRPALQASPVRAVADVVEAAAVDEVEERFLALVCADEELLRAEFDAIIASAWGQPTPPARPRPTRPPGPPAPRGEQRADGSAGELPGRQHYPAGERRSRQRAPPPGRQVSPRRTRAREGRW